MEFRTVCSAAALLSLPFGLGFVFAPAATAAIYTAAPGDPATLLVGRYFGSEMLMYAAAVWGLRGLRTPPEQRVAAGALAVATLCGAGVTLHGVLAGTMNAVGWSSVALYGGFAWCWVTLALREPRSAPCVA
jgi:hypothetical protein